MKSYFYILIALCSLNYISMHAGQPNRTKIPSALQMQRDETEELEQLASNRKFHQDGAKNACCTACVTCLGSVVLPNNLAIASATVCCVATGVACYHCCKADDANEEIKTR